MSTDAPNRTRTAEPIRANFGFNSARPRRRTAQAPGGKSDQELIADFLATKTVTRCPDRFADGAVRASGTYEF